MFFGTYRHQIDQKGRIRVPAKLKSGLSDGFVVTKGTDGCLFAFPKKDIETEIAEKFKNLPLFDLEVQKSARIIFSSAFETEEDNQGRILLPQELRKFAEIQKNVVFVGAGLKVEIWAEEKWNEYEKQTSFDEVVSKLGNRGV